MILVDEFEYYNETEICLIFHQYLYRSSNFLFRSLGRHLRDSMEISQIAATGKKGHDMNLQAAEPFTSCLTREFYTGQTISKKYTGNIR